MAQTIFSGYFNSFLYRNKVILQLGIFVVDMIICLYYMCFYLFFRGILNVVECIRLTLEYTPQNLTVGQH